MKKYAYFGYRMWSYKILKKLKSLNEFDIDSFTSQQTEYPQESLLTTKAIQPQSIEDLRLKDYAALFFYGWSWILKPSVFRENICVGLHPSPLPRYRGGSPIQNQIINGEDESAVTLFKLEEKLDSGDIYYQKGFSLEGDLSEVFNRVSEAGSELTIKILRDFEKGVVKGHPQNEAEATIYKRRKPEQSELKIDDLKHMTARQVHDFIRALQDPYPNAYVVGSDGRKVYLVKSKL